MTAKQVLQPMLGTPLYERLGLNTKELLGPVAAGFLHCNNGKDVLQGASVQYECRTWRVSEGSFHVYGEERTDGEEPYYEEWCDIGRETGGETEEALRGRQMETKSNEITNHGLHVLERPIRENRKSLKECYKGGTQASVGLSRLRLMKVSRSLRAKPN